MYEIVFARTARKELESLDSKLSFKILEKIKTLETNPRPSGCKKLKGEQNLWRLRIGDYRVVYSVDEINKLVDISVVRHRKDVYK
jgi:mRNA interferase RelE/StbE